MKELRQADIPSLYSYRQKIADCGAKSSMKIDTIAELLIANCGLGKTLDIGAGEGGLVEALVRRQCNAHGVDVSEVVVERCNARLPDRFTLGNVLSLPFADNEFDTIVSTHCLEHLSPEDVPAALAEMHRICKKNVLLQIATTQDRDGHWHLTGEGRKWWEQRCLEAGFIKHPRYYRVNGYEELNHDGLQIIIFLQKVTSVVMSTYPLSFLEAERGLHMDMLRDVGERSDAHVIRYDWACNYIKPGDRVLDAACGLGYGAHLIRNLTGASRVIGVDGSEHSIEYANKLYGTSENQVDYLCGMLPEFLARFPDSSFDVVVSFETLEHVEEPQALLEEFDRILVPGGRVIVSVPNDWSDETGEDPNPYHLHVYDWQKLKQQLSKHFILENAFAQTASQCKSREKGNQWEARARSLYEVEFNEESPTDCEWWLMTAMKSPLAVTSENYEERVFANISKTDHQSIQYGKYFQNPWLMHAMVNSEYRLRSRQALEKLSIAVTEKYAQGSNDYAAGLCVLSYSILVNHSSHRRQLQIGLLNEAQRAVGSDPMALRWHLSLNFVKAKLMESVGDQAGAMQTYLECARTDVRAFGIHLSTKTTEAAYRAGLIALALGDHQAAQSAWTLGVSLGTSLLDVKLADVLINLERPNRFNHGDGVREYAVAWDNVARCANGLNLLGAGKEINFSALDNCFQTEYQGVIKDLLDTRNFLVESNMELLSTRNTLRERTETLEVVAEELKSRTDELVVTREILRERTERLEMVCGELESRTDECQGISKDLHHTRSLLAASNKELLSTRNTLRERTETLEVVAEELKSRTDELVATRETLRDRTERLELVCEELESRTGELVMLREELRERTERLELVCEDLDSRTDELVMLREELRERTERLEARTSARNEQP
ncbi:methyltransferase domain-containing protein [Pseudomonas otitidis]|uniref:methyltransferase domain-containing protein n=1 Tax=Metapseudomonas otitidis TaxID=319939 RepID=UPI0024ADCEDD|nr:methyltransferase domain-containing protein [Pseudomonas otitidis]MDI6527831.1 methyltransferase domain-containing protein [Pseudomonas otitidis]